MSVRKMVSRIWLVCAMLFSGAPLAFAQVEMGSIPMWNTIGMINETTLNQSLFGTNYIPGDDDPNGPASTRIKLSDHPTAPKTLASTYPRGQRAQTEALFFKMLTTYGQLADQLGVDENDLSGAVAAFVAGSWMAYHDRDVSDEDFPVLVAQMRTALRATPELDQASLAEKQALYEHLAILGTLMAATRLALQRQPDAQTEAAMRTAAASYLEGFVGVDADDLVIDDTGLHKR